MREAILFVVTGPSGSGKGTVMRAIVAEFADIQKIATFTTRPPRPGEEHGFDYNFITSDEFLAKVGSGEIAEHERVYNDHYYGSPTFDPDRGPDKLMELDYKGTFKYKRITKRLVTIFVAPPSIEELVERINRRSSEANLENRVKNALEQMQYAEHYDYVVMNDNLDDACREALSIVQAERCKRDKGHRTRLLSRMIQNRTGLKP
jgi:guanylate kinase